MRFEEFTISDMETKQHELDTVLLTFGGLTWRPTHLPVGTTWYILRRLRDEVEITMGDRILTLPVQSIDTTFDDSALVQLPQEAFTQMASRYVRELLRHFHFRHVIILTDSLYKERLLTHALHTDVDSRLRILPFVWWRDGVRQSDSETGELNSTPTTRDFHPSGEWETALMMALAEHLVVHDTASLTRYLAQNASAKQGSVKWAQLSQHMIQTIRQFINESS